MAAITNYFRFMNVGSFLSISKLKEQVRSVAGRFPITVFFIVLSFASNIYNNHLRLEYGIADRVTFLTFYYPVSAMLLSLAITLYAEDRITRRQQWTVQGVAHVVWLCLCLWWAFGVDVGSEMYLPAVVGLALIVVGGLTLPFMQKDSDRACLNFTFGILGRGIITALICVLLFMLTMILLKSVNDLFQLSLPDWIYTDTTALIFVGVAPLLLLALLPTDEAKYNETNWLDNRFVSGVIHYLLIPLFFAYLLVLYVYLIKIVATWQLPDGMVALPVSVLVALAVLVEIMLHPVAEMGQGRRFDRLVVRYLPLAVVPLLVLMSIGLWRRISDYGLTVPRVYLVLFNAWCYVACFGLWAMRSRRVVWTVSSLAVLMGAVSVLPINVSSVTRNILEAQVRTLVAQAGVTTKAMDANTYLATVKALGYERARQMDDKLSYLRQTFGPKTTNAIVLNEVKPFGDDLEGVFGSNRGPATITKSRVSLSGGRTLTTETMAMPRGYRYVRDVSNYDETIVDAYIDGDVLRFGVKYEVEGEEAIDHFAVKIERLRRATDQESQPLLRLKGSKTLLVVNAFTLESAEKLTNLQLMAFLFVK